MRRRPFDVGDAENIGGINQLGDLAGEVPHAASEALHERARQNRAGEMINIKRTSLGDGPGEPAGDLVKIGSGYYRQYNDGRIYCNLADGTTFWVHRWLDERYTQLDGPDGWLGWPTSDEQDFSEGGRASTFQNGAIYWWPDTGAIELGNISLHYKGLYCFGESNEWSSADEPYVVFGVVPAPPGRASDVMTQVYTDVDDGDARPDLIELYRGLPFGLLLGVVLCEQDQGDPNKYREQIKQGVDKVGEAVATGCGMIPIVGVAAGPICKVIWEEVGPEIVAFVNDALGTGDDIIEKWNWIVTAKEMVTMARTPTRDFWGISYNLESKLLSDGDASYKVYLTIQAE
jgi:hypothetical protein